MSSMYPVEVVRERRIVWIRYSVAGAEHACDPSDHGICVLSHCALNCHRMVFVDGKQLQREEHLGTWS